MRTKFAQDMRKLLSDQNQDIIAILQVFRGNIDDDLTKLHRLNRTMMTEFIDARDSINNSIDKLAEELPGSAQRKKDKKELEYLRQVADKVLVFAGNGIPYSGWEIVQMCEAWQNGEYVDD